MADKNLINKLFDLVLPFLQKKAIEQVSAPVAPVEVNIEPEIDWTNPACKIVSRLSVKDALLLPSWGAYHVPSEDEKAAMLGIAKKVNNVIDKLSLQLGKELHINVHAWMRPEKANIPGSKWDGKDYNRYIYETQVWKDLTPEEKALKKVPNSPHKTGHAIDFHIVGYEGKEKCAEIRKLLLPLLEEFGLRMEDLDGGWVHLDDLPVIHLRFFKP